MIGKTPTSASRRGNRGGSKRSKSEEETRCVCGQQPLDHEGLMIQCELCKVWQHCACVDILDEKDCPEQYFCEQCKPENHPYLQYYKSNLKANSPLKPKKHSSEGGNSTHSDSKSSDESRKKKRGDQPDGPEVEPFSDLSDLDTEDGYRKESRSKRTKTPRNRSPSPISAGRKTKESESDEDYLSRGERRKKKANSTPKIEDRDYTSSKNRKRDNKSSGHGDEEVVAKEESQHRKVAKKDTKECSSSHESETPQKPASSNEETHTNGKRKKTRRSTPDHSRNSSRSKDGVHTPDNRRSPPVRVKNVSNRMTFQDMNRRTKHIFDCITRIQVSMAEKGKEEDAGGADLNGKGCEVTTMEMVEGLTRKLVHFQELYGDMR
ncbi:hypothetical protein K493DRAFT_71891 [Basidiobolus meristosporus CBS 931.73]|uniref:Zinc finger PHD-type domain-containing protein n=1 Tax=Basidiobolus meristosporus CBS 931.73 TaxID=1314790 RepID=A0A1Y1XTH2_9FUNG|nr:hypothetical protein K493DRAFT_71891 [Basidiobolus meristosporus CBS 931.73]|eukprot:ORX89077.1 hypothetical protein K493DRAFT_71891 [Basidiobolus meristosporus CBS 931.73]